MSADTTAGPAIGATSFAFPRHEQTFPTLTPSEIERMRRFGELRTYKDGDALFETGKPGPGMFVLLSGHVAITQRDGLGHVTPVIDQGPGQFLAEIGQLSDRVALVDGHAEGDVETLLIRPERLRALLVAEARQALERVDIIVGAAWPAMEDDERPPGAAAHQPDIALVDGDFGGDVAGHLARVLDRRSVAGAKAAFNARLGSSKSAILPSCP